MDELKKKLWHLIGASKGGPNRARIIMELAKKPRNAHQISEIIGMNYKTVRHHLKLLFDNDLITSANKGYGEMYSLSKSLLENFEQFKDILLITNKESKP